MPRNIYLLGCRCFSIFEAMLFTDNSMTNSIQIIFGREFLKKHKAYAKAYGYSLSIWVKHKEKNKTKSNTIPQTPW